MSDIHGLLLIDKPIGMSSHDVVRTLRRHLKTRKIGHGGTLDPQASGMLPLLIGDATRFARFFLEGKKRYHATVQLGVQTDTDDAEGSILATQPVTEAQHAQLGTVIASFSGTQQQVPPHYCARHYEGKRYYDWARQGHRYTPPAHSVTIEDIRHTSANEAHQFSFECTVSSGTYIRSIGRDIGTRLGCLGHLTSLRRLWSEPYEDAPMLSLDALDGDVRIHPAWHSMAQLMPHLPMYQLSTEEAIMLAQGKKIPVRSEALIEHQPVRMFYKEKFIGLCSFLENHLIILRLRPNPMSYII